MYRFSSPPCLLLHARLDQFSSQGTRPQWQIVQLFHIHYNIGQKTKITSNSYEIKGEAWPVQPQVTTVFTVESTAGSFLCLRPWMIV